MRIYLICIALFFNGLSLAQGPGSIIDSAIPVVNPLDPNGDGFVTSTGVAFTPGGVDETEFELPFLPIGQYQNEPGDDNQISTGCPIYDLVNDAANNSESSYYYFKDPDGIADNGDEQLFFRFRLARFSNGSTSYSILLDLDNKFGFSGTESDPNAVIGNPGFEKEVAAYTSPGSDGGVRVFNVDGVANATVINNFYTLDTHYQMAYALNQDPVCSPRVPTFVDMYVPFSTLGITSSTPFRMAVAVNEAIGSSLGGGASDIGGVNGNLIPNDDDQFIAAINNFTTIATGSGSNQAPIGTNATVARNENLSNGSAVHTVLASDFNGDVIKYSIVAGNVGTAFAINSGSGAITVINSAALNFETNPVFNLIVRASDGTLFDGVTITVNLINVNESPTSSSATVSLNENTLNGGPVHTLVASDPDAGAVLTYSIIGGGNTGTAFTINSSSGGITVNNSAALNYETTPSFTLTVRVSDGSLFNDASVTVNLVNVNEAPTASADATVSMNENTSTGTAVHALTGSDPEAGAVLTFSIVAGNTGTAFTINTSSGVITVNNSAALNFETTPSFALTVRLSDGSLFDDASVTVNLINVNEPPMVSDASVSLNENSINGAAVHSLVASDPDAGAMLSFSIIAGNGGTAFAINNSSGLISVNNSSSLNFETTPVFTVKVRLSDGALFTDAMVSINLQDVNEAPSASDALITLEANLPNGTIVHKVEAVDPDANDVLTFLFVGVNTNSGFSLNSVTGEIMINDSRQVSLSPAFEMGVRVNDRSDLAAIALIRIEFNSSQIEPLKGFSPDGDGINDFWLIKGIEAFPDNEVKVFNRWGNLVFETRNYDNNKISWSGESKGNSQVLESTYYYIITVRELKPLTGYLIVKK
ncbi:MAG: cadherin domain-containing protein [Cyclobacteriaceae bacterium]